MPPVSPPPLPAPSDGPVWYGNIQYLLNISLFGSLSCILIFLLLKLRSDHHRLPSPSSLLTQLLAVHRSTPSHVALRCGADAAQFLLLERSVSALLLSLSLLSLLFALPLNLHSSSTNPDLFATTTITNVPDSSPLLWAHFVLAVLVVAISHVGISRFEEGFWRRDGGQEGGASVEMFTVMVQGVPREFAADRAPVEEYFTERYPGKVCKVVVPFDLCRLEGLVMEWEKVTRRIENLEAKMGVIDENDGNRVLRTLKEVWRVVMVKLGFGDEERFRKLLNLRSRLAAKLIDYREGRAPGAGIAFVVFRDVYTANKAVRDLRCDRQKTAIGRFFSLVELQLELRRWRVERAPPAADIYWNHLGSSKLSLRLRRVAVNTCLLLMLLFCSSPLAIITAAKSAARIINAEAVDNAQMWLAWLEGSSWFVTVVLQFLPNVLIFVGMYIVVPSALSYLSKFEKHLTMSGEQRAAMLKMVCFFLVNLILLRVLVESSLENAILSMGRCYLDGADCKRIEQYMSASFLSKSCLSTLAFLIASTFLGISFDLLAPIPWIKKTLKKFSKNDMLQLVPEQNEEYSLNQNLEDPLRMPLVSERRETSPVSSGTDLQGQDLSVYPISRSFHAPKQTFDFAQYYAFNLTIFALTLIYSLFAPLVVPVGATYFGYRYIVDKYNFLFVYRVRGFPPGNDGKLMDSVLCIMHFCVVMFLVAMLFFFTVHGDSMKLQAIFTLGLLVLYKLLPLKSKRLQPSLLEGLQSVDSFIDGRTDYEVFSEPVLDWDAYQL